jgi:hypothetical protein
MSWFGGGSKKEEDKPKSMNIDEFHGSSSYNTDYAAPRSAAPSSSNFEEQVQLLQQQAMLQTLMVKLSDTAFEACVTKPSSSLSSSETSCITSVVSKYFEASQLIVGKLQNQES